MKRLSVLSAIIGLILANGMATADILYTLAPDTTFQEGCVGPCLCPVMLSEVVTGTFILVPAGTDPLFTHYNLAEISWTALDSNGGIAHRITGQGTYKVGGEVAIEQQLTLDLNIDGNGSQHFDSGLVPGGSEFPSLSISVSRGTSCFNIWIDIKASPQKGNLGGPNDIAVPGDYDGGGKSDIAIWRPENGTWYIIRSSDQGLVQVQWGGRGDIPVFGDFDGDGKADIAVWRPSNGYWYIINSSDQNVAYVQWGGEGDIPVSGDFDGDGKTDIAV